MTIIQSIGRRTGVGIYIGCILKKSLNGMKKSARGDLLWVKICVTDYLPCRKFLDKEHGLDANLVIKAHLFDIVRVDLQ